MADPRWLAELINTHPALAAEDRLMANDAEGLPPQTIRLGTLAHAFVDHAAEFNADQRRNMFTVLEHVLETGSAADGALVATGFFEALLGAYDRGFDLRPVWADLGPESRSYIRQWNDFAGVDSPAWMT